VRQEELGGSPGGVVGVAGQFVEVGEPFVRIRLRGIEDVGKLDRRLLIGAGGGADAKGARRGNICNYHGRRIVGESPVLVHDLDGGVVGAVVVVGVREAQRAVAVVDQVAAEDLLELASGGRLEPD